MEKRMRISISISIGALLVVCLAVMAQVIAQIIHAPSKDVTGGTITCDKFVDANGRIYYDWIPAIKLFL